MTFGKCLSILAFLTLSFVATGFGQENEFKKTVQVEKVTYAFSSLGHLQSEADQVAFLRHSNWIGLLNNEVFLKEIGVSDKHISSFRARISEFYRDWKSLTPEKFEHVCDELEKDFLLALKPMQKAMCTRQMAIREFYRMGPVEYAKSVGVSKLEIRKIESRLIEMAPKVKNTLAKLEKETLREIFEYVKEKDKLNSMVSSISPSRSACISIIGMSLVELENKVFNTKAKTNSRIPKFGLDEVGKLSRAGDLAVNPFSELTELISAQQWDLKNDPSLKVFFATKFDQMLENQRQRSIEEKQLRKKISKLPKGQSRDALREFREKYNETIADLANEIESEITNEEMHTLNQARFLAYLLREGPIETLTTLELTKSVGLKFSKNEFEKIKKNRNEILRRLKEQAKAIHDDFIDSAFKDIVKTEGRPLADLKWDTKAGVPPLEILLSFCESSGR